MRKLFFPIILGVSGVAVLLYLGFWQMQRLAWKEGILAEIDARMTRAPIALPLNPKEERKTLTRKRLMHPLKNHPKMLRDPPRKTKN